MFDRAYFTIYKKRNTLTFGGTHVRSFGFHEQNILHAELHAASAAATYFGTTTHASGNQSDALAKSAASSLVVLSL